MPPDIGCQVEMIAWVNKGWFVWHHTCWSFCVWYRIVGVFPDFQRWEGERKEGASYSRRSISRSNN